MTTTAHDALVDAMLAALRATPVIVDGQVVEEADLDAMPEGTAADISLELIGSQPGAVQYGQVAWDTTIRVSCRARRNATSAAGRAARAVHAAAYARLMADRTLGGLAETLRPPRLTTETATLATRVGVVHADYLIAHKTPLGSLASVADV